MDEINVERIHNLKQLVLGGESIPMGTLSSFEMSLVESWKYSMSKGISAGIRKLPDSNVDFGTKSRITEFMLYEWEQRADYYKVKHDLLASCGAAIFYIDQQGCIYSKGGSPEVIREMKEIGIKFGTNMGIDYIGTTGMTFMNNKKPVFYLYGEMNYIEALSGYVTMALDFSIIDIMGMCQMIIFPLACYTDAARKIMDAVYYLEGFHSAALSSNIVEIKQSSYSHTEEEVVVIVDANGRIMDVSQVLKDKFGMNSAMMYGRRIDAVFPKLHDAITIMRTGKNVVMEMEISGYHTMAEFVPVKKDVQVIGMVIRFHLNPEMLRSRKKTDNASVTNSTRFTFDTMTGESEAFLKAKTRAMLVAHGISNILLLGESGTGKEVFAQSIHNASDRRSRPFVALNCAAIPKDLIASELFGYEDGAFTGARKNGSIGKFEQANGGTLFLDEIGEMPYDMQSVLLRALENKEVMRVGGSKARPVDVRIISATNRDIRNAVKKGFFRQDLYYRLNVIQIDLPPLRERRRDIPLLAADYLEKFSFMMKRPVMRLDDEALRLLCRYDWPGNIRQLRNVIEAAVALSTGHLIDCDALPGEIREMADEGLPGEIREIEAEGLAMAGLERTDGLSGESSDNSAKPQGGKPAAPVAGRAAPPLGEMSAEPADLPARDEAFEAMRARILLLMEKYNGNQSEVTRELGISRGKLSALLKRIREDRSGQAAADNRESDAPMILDYNDYDDYERAKILYLLQLRKHNCSLIAEEMGLAKSTLYRKMKKYHIE